MTRNDNGNGNGMRLDGRVIVVTGAGRGLGGVTANVLGELGASVAVLDVDQAAAEAHAKTMEVDGTTAIGLGCDVSSEGDVDRAVSVVCDRFGRIDGLVNNAGVISWSPLEDLPVEEWDRLTAVNLRGAFLCTKHVGRRMLDQESGSIVNVGSVAGGAPQPNSGAYSPTKAAMIMLARQVAVEWGPVGIRSNAVSPGIMQTPMAERFISDPETLERRRAMVASRRMADPREVGLTIAWLLGPASTYVNGQNIEVDGGMMQMFLGLLPRPGTPPLR